VITNGNFDINATMWVTNAGPAPVVTPAGTCPIATACIFFQDPVGVNGKFDISNSNLPNGDIPLAIFGNDAGNIGALMNPPEIVGNFPLTPFISFNNAGITTILSISRIEPGIFPSTQCGDAPAVGQVCTLPGSPFSFSNNPGLQASATFVLDGTTSGNPGFQSNWTANLTVQFPTNTPYQTVFSNLNTNGFVTRTVSGTISLSTVPEPESLLIMGSGLIGLATLLRRRIAK